MDGVVCGVMYSTVLDGGKMLSCYIMKSGERMYWQSHSEGT